MYLVSGLLESVWKYYVQIKLYAFTTGHQPWETAQKRSSGRSQQDYATSPTIPRPQLTIARGAWPAFASRSPLPWALPSRFSRKNRVRTKIVGHKKNVTLENNNLTFWCLTVILLSFIFRILLVSTKFSSNSRHEIWLLTHKIPKKTPSWTVLKNSADYLIAKKAAQKRHAEATTSNFVAD
jgi:hypothetical protein